MREKKLEAVYTEWNTFEVGSGEGFGWSGESASGKVTLIFCKLVVGWAVLCGDELPLTTRDMTWNTCI